MEATDEQLMLAYRDGDPGAFDSLYARHRSNLYRFVLRSIKDRATADELYQEIWMRVIEARSRYEPAARFTTWLFTIAHNRIVDHWRRRGLVLVSLDDEQGALHEPAAGAFYDPARKAEAREGMVRLALALEALPPLQREAFMLHEEAGMTVAEIAAATGVGVEAAKSRLRYALGKLREAIRD